MFQTTDEIGYLGAGKVGRQVLIQILDEVVKPKNRVTSDFFDRPFIVRLFLGVPLSWTFVNLLATDFHGLTRISPVYKRNP